jgi:hypothetical protein
MMAVSLIGVVTLVPAPMWLWWMGFFVAVVALVRLDRAWGDRERLRSGVTILGAAVAMQATSSLVASHGALSEGHAMVLIGLVMVFGLLAFAMSLSGSSGRDVTRCAGAAHALEFSLWALER